MKDKKNGRIEYQSTSAEIFSETKTLIGLMKKDYQKQITCKLRRFSVLHFFVKLVKHGNEGPALLFIRRSATRRQRVES